MRRALALLLALACAAPAAAAAPRASFTDIEDEVMCVSCNVVLNIAESPQADRQRALIRSLVDRGLSKEEIKDRLVAEYGGNVLALPDDDGFGLAAYLVPVVVGIALVGGLALLLPRWRRRATAPAFNVEHEASAVSEDEARRLDEDMRRYDE